MITTSAGHLIGGARKTLLHYSNRISPPRACIVLCRQSHFHYDARQSQQRYTTNRRLFVAGSLVATVIATTMFYYKRTSFTVYSQREHPTKPAPADRADAGDQRPKARADLPTFRMHEVNKHNGSDSPTVWVTYGAGVYDVTDFVPQHPGNRTNIMMAAGSAVDPFWLTFQQHNTAAVRQLLETFRIGNLHADDAVSMADLFDPWLTEPLRHPLLRPASLKPFNAEPPAGRLIEEFITPADLFYVRNHLPVPVIVADDYELTVDVDANGSGSPAAERTLSLAELQALPKHSVTATIMCGGNRRSEMHAVRPVRGLHWGRAAVGTAEWSGARLCDVLAAMGVRSDDQRHVHFEGLDVDASAAPYAASIPLYKAMDPRGDVILAYEMNGQPLQRDHGYPVRVVVPGVVGARHVKWLGRVRVAAAECESHWQQGDYKGFSPSTDWDTVDFSRAVSMQNMPVTSAICNLSTGDTVRVTGADERLEVRGYAWSGGGSRILRVDLTADGGQTWHVAELQHGPPEDDDATTGADTPSESAGTVKRIDRSLVPPVGRDWAWTLWRARLPVPPGAETVEVWSKAVDANYNVQPETFENTWNLRGVLSHAYCRVRVNVSRDDAVTTKAVPDVPPSAK